MVLIIYEIAGIAQLVEQLIRNVILILLKALNLLIIRSISKKSEHIGNIIYLKILG